MKFDELVAKYQEAPNRSGYNRKLKFQEIIPTNPQQRDRKRNIIWFGSPFRK